MLSIRVLALCLVIILLSPFFYTNFAYAQQTRLYAGYALYVSDGYSGVYGNILTIDPYVSSGNFLCEWVTIILMYVPNSLWLQVGYWKGEGSGFQLKYYFEVRSYRGYLKQYFETPRPSYMTWHNYMIAHPYDYGESSDIQEWRFYIDHARIMEQDVDPPWGIDQQASAETTSGTVHIDGSHFERLSYFTQDKYWHWILWDTHVAFNDTPYTLTQTHNYEFYANGGG